MTQHKDERMTQGITTSGFQLRYVLTTLMAGQPHRTWSVADLVESLAHFDVAIAGRPSKVVSDTLRSEIYKGRVERVGRGLYRFTDAPPSTLRRIRNQARPYLRRAA